MMVKSHLHKKGSLQYKANSWCSTNELVHSTAFPSPALHWYVRAFMSVMQNVSSANEPPKDHTGSGVSAESQIDIVLTNTHVFTFRDAHPEWSYSRVLVQAFTVPDDAHPVENGSHVLRLSHEGEFRTYKAPVAIIRNSVIDPITGSVNVRFLEKGYHRGIGTICMDFTLQKPPAAEVLPITIENHDVARTGDDPSPLYDLDRPCNIYYGLSDDGYARGLLALEHCHRKRSCIVKFTVDATQDRCAVTLGQIMPTEWCQVVCPLDCMYDAYLNLPYATFDGVRGRLFYPSRFDRHVKVIDLE